MSAELPKGTYLFSFFSKRAVPVLVRRAWWKVFGRDRIELAQREERTVLAGLSAEEATVIRDLARDWLSPGGRVLTRLMGQAPSKVQLELGALSSSYVATTTTPRDPFVAPVLTHAQVAETTFWHDYPACGLYRGGRCTCDAQGDAP